MIPVSVKLADYAISMDQLTNMAEECFGRHLAGAGEGESATMDFGFEGDATAARHAGISQVQHAERMARTFVTLVDHPTWRVAG